MGIYLPGAGTLGCVAWPGAGTACSPVVPLGFYLPHVNIGPPVLLAAAASQPLCLGSLSLPLLPIWMNVLL